MKVTVITVCLNSKETIERALQSVRSQTYQNLEHIVIDGGSTDGTLDVIESHRRNSMVIISEPDHGLYDAMNKGVKKSTGDIVCFLNSDDYYSSKETISEVVENFKKYNLDFCLTDVEFFHSRRPEKKTRVYRSKSFKPRRLAWGFMPAHPGLFSKREVFEKCGYFDTTFKISGDYEWIVRCFKRNNFRYLHLEIVSVRMQAGGISNNGLMSFFVLNKEVLRACEQNGIYTNWIMILSKYPRKILEYVIRK